MSITTVLFDLDGTLLPLEQDDFVKEYLHRLAVKMAPYGYDPKKLMEAIWRGTGAMVANDGSSTNEQVFWNEFCDIYGESARKDEHIFEEFYRNEFQAIKDICGFDVNAQKTVKYLKEKGIRVALATNPVFPAIATESRIAWAGLNVDDFELYTTYENSVHCKPNPEYYKDILTMLGASPEDTVMVGNDVDDDMSAESLGMKVFLLTDHLVNRKNVDISRYPNGGYDALLEYLNSVI